MPHFVQRIITVEATRWYVNGDHPDDDTTLIGALSDGEWTEGKVVKRYPYIQANGALPCVKCGDVMMNHGWIGPVHATGMLVCPGDYVVTGLHGNWYPCKPDVFKAAYQEV